MHARRTRPRGPRLLALACAGAAAIGAGSAMAAAPNGHRYAGQTSQRQPVAFTLRSGQVTHLSFWVVITCKSRRRYAVRAFGFAPIPVHAGRFHRRVSSTHPSAGATVTGLVTVRRVKGTLSLHRFVRPEHGNCAGTATFDLRPAMSGRLRPQRAGTTI